jgi:choline dehydrogenase-like flavoprotein
MIDDIRQYDQDLIETDVLIVGSGPAGISLGLQFESTKHRVIILESGGRSPKPEYENLNTGKNTGPLFLDLSNSRKRCLGGASKIWAGVCRPLEAEDFQKRKQVPFSGWPISKKDLDPYYNDAAKLVGIDSSLLYQEGWNKDFEVAVNFPFDKRPNSNVKGKLFQQISTDKRDFGVKYEEKLENSKNIRVLLHGTLTDIKLSSTSEIVSEVEVSSLNNKKRTIRAKKIVLACGALENPRILLLANKSQKEGLGNSRGNVGRYFMSHPGFSSIAQIVKQDDRSCLKKAKRYEEIFGMTVEFNEKLKNKKSLIGHNFNFKNKGKKHFNLARKIKRRLSSGRLTFAEVWDSYLNMPYSSAFNDAACNMQGKEFFRQDWYGSVSIEQIPNPNSRLSLDNDVDSLGQKKISFHWDKISDLEKESVRKIVHTMGIELGRLGMGRVKYEENLIDGSAFEISDSINHQMGTTRMADSPKDGVVDKDCRVFGIKNLYIAGGSVFSTAGSVNPTFTIIALSLRLADHLKGALNS